VKFCVHASELAPGLMLGHDVELGTGVELGANVVIHSGTSIGNDCDIQDGAVLGKLPRLGRRSTAGQKEPEPLVVEDGAVICAGAVVYRGARIGRGAIVGDQAQVRERASIGPGSVVGRGSGVENDVTIGADVLMQSNCFLAARTMVEDEVFIAPAVVMANDNAMGRHEPGEVLHGPTLRRRCRVGIGAVLVPGVEIGEEAFVAAGAVVCADVAPRAVVMGVPARQSREVPDEDLWARWR
jgi:acetyltransferase-like isoleucine patch superfamily enzyme